MGQDRVADDQLQLSLSGASRKRLVAALLDAFDRAGFEQLARFHLNEDFEEIAGGGNLRQMAFSLVEWADSHGRLPDLVAGALAENSGNPALRAFNEEVWSRALAGDPAVLATPGEEIADSQRRSPGVPVIAGALVAVIAIAAIAWFLLGHREGAPPSVSLSDASLVARTVGADGQDVVDIGFQIALDNYQGASVVVEATALDADSLQPIRFGSPPPPQRFSPDRPSESVRGTFRFPYTRASQCIVVRIAAFAGADYPESEVELTQTETPGFDAWDPANPSCPREAA